MKGSSSGVDGDNAGVMVYNTSINSGAGALTLDGKRVGDPFRSGGLFIGTEISSAISTGNVTISSTSGNINLEGTTESITNTHSWACGLLIVEYGGDDVTITSTSGNITLYGDATSAAAQTGEAVGFVIQSDNTTGLTRINTDGGTITITGSSGNTGNDFGATYRGANTPGNITIGDANTGNITLRFGSLSGNNNVGAVSIQSAGNYVLEGVSGSAFATAIDVNTSYSFGSSGTGLRIGSTNNNQNITMQPATSIAGPISIYGGTITLNANLTTTNNGAISLYSDNPLGGLSSARTLTAAGAFKYIPRGTAFTAAVTYPITNLTAISTGLTIGKTTNDKNITINQDVIGGAGIELYGNNVNINSNLKTTNGGLMYLKGNTTIAAGKYIECSGNFTHDGNITFKSNATGTAAFGTLGGTFTRVTGNVNVERFIPAGNRAFRFLTPSVTTTGTIRANWQEGQNNTTTSLNSNTNPGYGTHITGSTTGANGFDATLTGNPSMYTFDNTSTATDQNTVWSPIANTDVLGLSAGTGYRIMVRGSRAVDLTTNTPAIDATTLEATGTLLTGAVTMNSAGTGTAGTPRLSATPSYFSLVGNPYASPISWNALTKTDLTGIYYAWDPTEGTKGAYVSFDGTNSSNTGSEVSDIIQPGQAFFVQNASSVTAPALVFQEANKTTGNTNVFRTQTSNAVLSTQLMLTANAANNHSQDGLTIVCNNNFSNNTDDEDANKLTNPGENIAVERNNRLMSIEKRAMPTINDIIQLKLWQLAQDNYTLRFNGSNFAGNLNAYIKDNYLGSETPINLNGTTDYNFTTTSTAATTAANRFTIVFRSNSSLPVNILNVSAAQKNAGIEVNWNTASESNMDSYEVEESSNATTFTKAATVAAKNGASNAYNWFDATVNNGDNYYRIKAIEKNGTVKYSNVVKVKIGGKNAEFTVYPNPVKDGIINLQMSNVEKGVYTVKIFNNAGQEVANRRIINNGGSATETITLDKGIAKGNYKMQITNGTTSVIKSVIVE
jgi:hypothetical protein